MTTRRRTPRWASLTLAGLLAVGAIPLAFSQPGGGGPGGRGGGGAAVRSGGGPNQHFDGRFGNNHYYYDRGYSVRRPAGGIGGLRGPDGGRYWFHGGNWYLWRSGAWVVWGAPVGIFVPWLPPYFSTVWWYGVPYYYANDTYYVWDRSRRAYQVVASPDGIDSQGTTRAPASSRLFVYPSNGQSSEQQSKDRYECHRWAVQQSGFDPTVSGGGVLSAQAVQKRDDYFRAEASCLQGRGYTVR